MASTSQASGSQSGDQEYTVRVPRDSKKRFSIMKFNPANKVDFTSCGEAKIERENNFREYKLSNDIDQLPKFGAGSEFGREQKDEARRKKYGIMLKKYNPEDQPWLLKLGNGKAGKPVRKFKGSKEGGVGENASYYIFTQCPDGAFEAHPVDEWHKFAPIIKYKYLNSEEAEEEFNRRDKTMNYFSIMLKKRLTNKEDVDLDGDEEEKKTKGKGKSKKKDKDFMLTELDDWANLTDDDIDDDSDMEGGDEEKGKKKEPKTKGKGPKKKKNNSDSEALEESDDIDEGKEVDYMTSSDSEDADMYAEQGTTKSEKYEEKGVEDEEGLRKVIESGDEDEEEEKKEGEEDEEQDKDAKEEKSKKADSDSDSSSSGSDSDPEKDGSFTSALFMQNEKKKPAPARRGSASSEGSAAANSRSATPTVPTDDKNKKRKTGESDSPAMKKPRTETPTIISQSSSDGITEDSVRRYLMRKPMTTIDLLQKFKSKNTGLSKDQLVTTIAQILKKINPEKTKIKDKLYLFIKKP